MTEEVAREIAKAINETATEIQSWAAGGDNRGMWAEEAYRTNVHIGAALRLLASKLASLLEQEKP